MTTWVDLSHKYRWSIEYLLIRNVIWGVVYLGVAENNPQINLLVMCLCPLRWETCCGLWWYCWSLLVLTPLHLKPSCSQTQSCHGVFYISCLGKLTGKFTENFSWMILKVSEERFLAAIDSAHPDCSDCCLKEFLTMALDARQHEKKKTLIEKYSCM